jgi:hypothetical protein
MRTFYFVGGPTPGDAEAFFRRLEAAGGPPPGWRIYPHACGDGKALHIVPAESTDPINAHLAQFADIYEATPPIELAASGGLPARVRLEGDGLCCLKERGTVAPTMRDVESIRLRSQP